MSPAKAGQAPLAWRQHHPTLAELAPHTNPYPGFMRLIFLVLSAWKMSRLNGQDKRTGRRHSSGGSCRRSSEKTEVKLHLPVLLSSCYHTSYFSIDFRASLCLSVIPLANLSLPFTLHIYLQEMHGDSMGGLHLHGVAKLSWQGCCFKVSCGGSAVPSGTASGITTSASATHPGFLPLCYKEEVIVKS